MEKNKLRKETENLQTQLKKLESTKEQLEENEILKVKIQKMETYICHLQLQNEISNITWESPPLNFSPPFCLKDIGNFLLGQNCRY